MLKDKLLKLRSDVAKENHGATYLVFNDKELEELLLKQPKSIEELSKIKGFPKNGKRVQCYGSRLVSIFSVKGSPMKQEPSKTMKTSNLF